VTDSTRQDLRQVLVTLGAAGIIGAIVSYGTIRSVESQIDALNRNLDSADKQRHVDQEAIYNAIKQVDSNSASRRTETREELYNAISRLQTEVSDIRTELRSKQK
jgi:hypothetical protein